MAPKAAKAAVPAAVEDAMDPTKRCVPPEFDEESLAALSFDLDTPYTDPDPQLLPPSLEAVVTSWKRPSEYLQSLCDEGASPYVVQPAIPDAEVAAAARELPNLLEPVQHATAEETPAAMEARCALQWMISCIQLVALNANRVEEDCFLWELIHPQIDGRPRHVLSGKYAVKLFEQGAWRLVIVDDKMPFDAEGGSILPRSVACRSSHRRTAAHPQSPLSPAPATASLRRQRPSSCGLCCSPRPSTSSRPARRRASRRTQLSSSG